MYYATLYYCYESHKIISLEKYSKEIEQLIINLIDENNGGDCGILSVVKGDFITGYDIDSIDKFIKECLDEVDWLEDDKEQKINVTKMVQELKNLLITEKVHCKVNNQECSNCTPCCESKIR